MVAIAHPDPPANEQAAIYSSLETNTHTHTQERKSLRRICCEQKSTIEDHSKRLENEKQNSCTDNNTAILCER